MPLTDFGEIIPEWCPRREEELESEEGSPEQSQEVQDEYKAINLTRIKQGLSLVSLSLAASSATLYSFPEVPESPQHKALRQKRKQLKKNKKRGRR